MGKSIIVIDNFYSNPNSVRELALESELFDKCDLSENFSGNESIYNFSLPSGKNSNSGPFVSLSCG